MTISIKNPIFFSTFLNILYSLNASVNFLTFCVYYPQEKHYAKLNGTFENLNCNKKYASYKTGAGFLNGTDYSKMIVGY